MAVFPKPLFVTGHVDGSLVIVTIPTLRQSLFTFHANGREEMEIVKEGNKLRTGCWTVAVSVTTATGCQDSICSSVYVPAASSGSSCSSSSSSSDCI